MNKKVLSFDPSGNFHEGKGTTGWCVLSHGNADKLIIIDSISAKDYRGQLEYWNAHLELIAAMYKKYGSSLVVSMEDYLLYASCTATQINSHFETPQLIGVIKMWCYLKGIPVYTRNAVAVKKRWSDEILVRKGILTHSRGHYYSMLSRTPLCDHERDAIRHAIHYVTFELNKD